MKEIVNTMKDNKALNQNIINALNSKRERELLQKRQEFKQLCMEIALHHHEKYDGYPNGLRGDDIPIAARLIRHSWNAYRGHGGIWNRKCRTCFDRETRQLCRNLKWEGDKYGF